MQPRGVHGPSVALGRRLVLGGLGLSPVLFGVVARAASNYLPDFGAQECIPLWAGAPPGRTAGNLTLRIEEQSPDPDRFHSRILRGIDDPMLCVFRATSPNGSALLVIPGGGYRGLNIDTAFAAAWRFARSGITAFVLLYRLPREGWPDAANVPLQDAMRAMRILRAGFGRHAVDPGRIGVLGFSAGGHLAATLSLRAERQVYAPLDTADRADARPSFAALLYPVITMLPPFAHEASRQMLLGDHVTTAQRAAFSCERLVTHDAPPMFLAAAADDTDVSVENTLAMFAALRRVHVPAEMHIFEHGGHGFGIAAPDQPLSAWPDLLLKWIAVH